MKWQDIGTAPKDGTRILALLPTYKWHDSFEPNGCYPAIISWEFGKWRTAGGITVFEKNIESWRPVPKTPKHIRQKYASQKRAA